MLKNIYLDNNATTKPAPEVVEAILPFLTESYGNPSSIHSFGGNIGKHIDKAREQIMELFGADYPYEVVFTATGTESDNTAIQGLLQYHHDKRHIITTRVEHPAVLSLYKKLERDGYRTTYLSVDRKGNLDLDELKQVVEDDIDDTALVSIMYANNETGVIFPVNEIGEYCKSHNIPFHIDAVQAVGKIPIKVNEINCDMMSISGHKFHATKGIGALYVRRGTRMRPILFGGHQEKERRPGTENVPGIIGMGKAAELALSHLDNLSEMQRLRDKLETSILTQFKNSHLNGDKNNRVPNTTNIGFEYIEGEAILLYLDQKGVAASSGSACSSGSLEPSHVLRAMGVPFTSAHGSIRFSLSRYTTEEEIDYTIKILPDVVNSLLEISPYWDNEKQQGIPISPEVL